MSIAASHKYYYRAAWERLRAAQDLLEDAPVLSLYLSGLTVECMLRAWLDPNRPFDGRHHLPSLLEESKILHELGEDARQRVTVAVKDLTLLWTNSIRYYPEDRVAQELKKLRPYRNKRKSSTKGWKGLLRLAAQEALKHVAVVVKAGEER
ncbi:MAG: hypothetical protein ACQEXJ_00010 [Myxococcota bacterium]